MFTRSDKNCRALKENHQILPPLSPRTCLTGNQKSYCQKSLAEWGGTAPPQVKKPKKGLKLLSIKILSIKDIVKMFTGGDKKCHPCFKY